jgi:hypothetical protein
VKRKEGKMTKMAKMAVEETGELFEEALFNEFPWLAKVEKGETGLTEELVLTFIDGSRASVPLISGFPAPEDPEGPFGQAVLRAWWKAKGARVK